MRITVVDLLKTQHTDHVLEVCAVLWAKQWLGECGIGIGNVDGMSLVDTHTHTLCGGGNYCLLGCDAVYVGRNLSAFH